MRDTGVRFKDIAGLNHILVEMREVVKMLLNDPAYAKVRSLVPLHHGAIAHHANGWVGPPSLLEAREWQGWRISHHKAVLFMPFLPVALQVSQTPHSKDEQTGYH